MTRSREVHRGRDAASSATAAQLRTGAEPDSSNVNYRALQTQANLVVTRIGPNRTVVLDVHGSTTHLIADLVAADP